MDKQALIDKLNLMLTEDRSEEEQLFIKLVQQVWEIDPYESLYSMCYAADSRNIMYFLRFMEEDEGLEENEMKLIDQMIINDFFYPSRMLIDELNQARESIW